MIGPSLARPFLAVMLCVALFVLTVLIAARGKPKLEGKNLSVVVMLAIVALAVATTAAWASTHEFYSQAGNCTAVASAHTAGQWRACGRRAPGWR